MTKSIEINIYAKVIRTISHDYYLVFFLLDLGYFVENLDHDYKRIPTLLKYMASNILLESILLTLDYVDID